MEREEIFNKVAEILNETFEIPLEEIKSDSLIQEDLDLDSIDAVDLIVKLQKYTSKNIDPAEFKLVKTVDDVVSAIEKLFAQDKQ
jgi:acyl carrier protein